jgi:hypothetical protein
MVGVSIGWIGSFESIDSMGGKTVPTMLATSPATARSWRIAGWRAEVISFPVLCFQYPKAMKRKRLFRDPPPTQVVHESKRESHYGFTRSAGFCYRAVRSNELKANREGANNEGPGLGKPGPCTKRLGGGRGSRRLAAVLKFVSWKIRTPAAGSSSNRQGLP